MVPVPTLPIGFDSHSRRPANHGHDLFRKAKTHIFMIVFEHETTSGPPMLATVNPKCAHFIWNRCVFHLSEKLRCSNKICKNRIKCEIHSKYVYFRHCRNYSKSMACKRLLVAHVENHWKTMWKCVKRNLGRPGVTRNPVQRKAHLTKTTGRVSKQNC